MNSILEKYPDYTAEVYHLRENPITPELLEKIINKHSFNSCKNKRLYDRYCTMAHAVPIFTREPRFDSDGDTEPINNKVNNDFYSEIIDIKVGYFAGNPISYSYSNSSESEEETGSKKAVEEARKEVSDFVARNNMIDVDMETTKLATICGYAGRLFYVDKDGEARVMVTMPYETIILSEKDITEPEFAVRYLELRDICDRQFYVVEFYDDKYVWIFKGDTLSSLELKVKKEHMFIGCPLQGVPNNLELMGDAEKVLELIDAYDRSVSDANNEIESFANAYMVFENVQISDKEVEKAQKTGAFQFYSGGGNGKIYFLTKQVDDGFIEHHLDRLEDNIYRFSKTPNLGDESFGNSTGVALKFKITGLETKCGMFEGKMKSAGMYMFKLLSKVWSVKKQINCDPLQCVMEFKRNFPLDLTSEAQACATLIGCGLPKEIAFSQLSFIDDPDYVMQLIEEEVNNIPSLDNKDDDEMEFEDGDEKKDDDDGDEKKDDDEEEKNKKTH